MLYRLIDHPGLTLGGERYVCFCHLEKEDLDSHLKKSRIKVARSLRILPYRDRRSMSM